MPINVLVTGGAGFIGSALLRYLATIPEVNLLNFDKLTYAGNLHSLAMLDSHTNYQFVQGDVCDNALVARTLREFKPTIVMHLAAESHVDRSIDSAAEFMQTNIIGTYTMLEQSLQYWKELEQDAKDNFRFHHISTDEVYGSLGDSGKFLETTSYDPSSPYSASKASSDHLVRAWHRTYGLPVVLTNCSNNYGPYQFPEKLIPHMIISALNGKPLPVYGTGQNIRDWLHVDDHVKALWKVVTQGKVGETYNIGGDSEKTNLQVIQAICEVMNELVPHESVSYFDTIEYVKDRPGHDFRYAIDAGKIQSDLDWKPLETFESGLRQTVEWYLSNREWWQKILDGDYQHTRIGLKQA